MTDAILPWLALALLVFWAVGAYNRLVRLRAQVLLAFQGLDARLAHFVVLLQQHPPLAFEPLRPQPMPVASGTWAGLHSAGSQFDLSLRIVRRQVLDAESMAALQSALATLHDWWERLEHVRHPDQEPSLAPWRSAWFDNRRQAVEAAAVFNRAVQAHNDAITEFPALLLARVFGFRPAGCL